ncbi:MAG TPA: DUF4349 domain-containing protein [Pyrinomonadaceae bacterium]|jgi:hypothetical protein|nr:DUF4349 domain-containing protein [Pyrinomonadaceae bacterium]
MKLSIAVTCLTFLLALSACSRSGNRMEYDARSNATTTPAEGAGGVARQEEINGYGKTASATANSAEAAHSGDSDLMETKPAVLSASLAQTGESQASQQAAVERKIIRDAEINIEVASPAEGQHKLGAIAEAHGGFVVTSESRLQGEGGGQAAEIVTVQMRVPSSRFDAAVAEIRAVGSRVRAQKITGKDVTEEFIDLDARLRTQRALEAQFLEIMKRADKVSDALEVHRQLAEVRTEIERVEGRRRFLENQAALSTINVTIQPPAPLVGANTSGFLHGVRGAFGDGVDIAAEIILGIISISIALLPVLLFIVLPLALVWRYLLRPRLRRRKPPAPPASAMP